MGESRRRNESGSGRKPQPKPNMFGADIRNATIDEARRMLAEPEPCHITFTLVRSTFDPDEQRARERNTRPALIAAAGLAAKGQLFVVPHEMLVEDVRPIYAAGAPLHVHFPFDVMAILAPGPDGCPLYVTMRPQGDGPPSLVTALPLRGPDSFFWAAPVVPGFGRSGTDKDRLLYAAGLVRVINDRKLEPIEAIGPVLH
jgi:hypothetical protein